MDKNFIYITIPYEDYQELLKEKNLNDELIKKNVEIETMLYDLLFINQNLKREIIFYKDI